MLEEWPCLAGSSVRGITVAATPPLPVALLGTSSRTIVLSDESDEDACSWLPLARTLTAAGYQVALYDYTGDPRDDVVAVVRYLRAHGAHSVALVGASEGAKTSIVAAAGLHPTPDAVVSLSAESTLQGAPVAPYAARLGCPTLFVTAAEDPYGSTAATRQYFTSNPAIGKRLVVVPGQAHGTVLLADAAVHAAVRSFLAAHVR